MVVLDSCPKHNMVAYLEKSEGNEEFHEIIDFLKRSSIHFALTVSPIVSTTFVEQFWTSAKSKTINNVRHITAKVAGKSVSISEASIRQRFPRKSFSKKHRVHKEYVSKQGRKFAKGESSVQRDFSVDEMTEDTFDHMDTENAQSEGRTREIVDEDKEIDEVRLSTEDVVSTDELKEGIKDPTEEEMVTQTSTQTPTSKILGDDETIAKPSSTRSLLTLKPLPKIDPKDKGKKKIEEVDESESESDDIPQAEKKFKQLESDEELARKMQEEWEAEEERNRIAEENAANEELIRDFDDMKARIKADRLLAEKLQEQEDLNAVYQLVMEKYQDEMPEGFDRVLWGDLMVLFNPNDKDEFWSSQLDWIIKKYLLRKEVLMQMLKLKLGSEEESTMALELIKFVKKILAELESEE
ncbi:hypothetical protein Tco_0801009 [Tanacetum coccineum]|uniref:Uncharacterized protein n=1 Tax=Tanacetum coccineum TaxID=301880 RepID=A0ABQ4ZXM5_9ASTR